MSEVNESDFDLLREAFAQAQAAREAGDHPFGAILAGPDGNVLMRQGNGYRAEGQDMTAHAERVLATRASKAHRPDFLAGCTMYVSAEPCAMCAGAIYWSGIGRVVYGQSEADLKRQTGAHDENPTLDLPCRMVFAAGQRVVDVVGPLLGDEAAALQEGFWEEKRVNHGKQDLAVLNTLTVQSFVQVLGGVFEHAPWVAEAAAAERPFASIDDLHAAMFGQILAAPDATKLAFLRGHPELAGEHARRSTLAAHSASEQSSLGLDQPNPAIAETFDVLNAEYREKFGFPFIICVRRHTLGSIISQFRARMLRDGETEMTQALTEIGHITRLRLAGLVEGKGDDPLAGWLSTHVLDTGLGRPAAGMSLELVALGEAGEQVLGRFVTNNDGRTNAPILPKGEMRIGLYELRFDVEAYFAALEMATPEFLGVVPIRFRVSDPQSHYHVPLLVSPGGYSTYRGS